ncbi:glycosyltransferase family 87 protein [Pontibacter akesuensis]|uniref:DUF2029 domain-containing protein n=1 Tax=Pontibacter akesuensis TaxID=388950 RepID=A0A1I7K2W8_9BACT|nr:glycosyltransferase family 87 protein [Pontibacter akesuensis]GHA75475.1 membrane protein [Pontibacter akesuensis]SFU91808.1 Protein of unknown function [Pontibacter akesuensis]
MRVSIERFVANKRNLIIIFAVFAVFASLQSYFGSNRTYVEKGIEYEYNRYNNYTIFERSFYHLKNNQNLYVTYPQEHGDLYKYTPTFSVFFGLFAMFPDWLGLSLWNLLNALVLLFGIYYLPRLSNLQKGLVLLIVLAELLTSMQNEQSNALIAGLLVLAYGLLEKRKYLLATLCIVFSAYIKLFGIVGFALFLLYPKKWKMALYTTLWTAVLFLVPLLFVSYEQYLRLFSQYGEMLANDHSASYGFSVMGWLNTWFNLEFNKNVVVLLGALVFMIPFVRLKEYGVDTFRYLALTSILIWVVIFNHKAESPTFIIAMTGVALWYMRSERTILNVALFVAAFVFTGLAATDVFPKFIRDGFFEPYVIKAVPCILIWAKVIYEMMVLKYNRAAKHVVEHAV